MRAGHSRMDAHALRPLTAGLYRVHAAAVARPRAVVGTAMLVTIAVIPLASQVSVHLSIRDLVDPRSPAALALERRDRSFGLDQDFLIVFRPPDGSAGFSEEQSRALAEWILRCSERPEVHRMRSPLDLVRLVESRDGLHAVPRLEGLTPVSLALLRGTPWQGIVTDSDCRDAAIEVSIRASTEPTRYGTFDPAAALAIFRDARDTMRNVDARIDVHLVGSGAFDAYALQGIRRFRLLNLAVVLLLVLLARAAFGTWRSGLLMLVPLGVAATLVYGGMAIRGDPVDLLSTGLFLLLAVASIEDFYFLSHLRLRSGSRWRSAFRRLLLPSALTSLTTVLGFGSLLASDLEIVRRLGLWAAVGAALEWAAVFLLLPAIMELFPAARRWTDRRRAWRIDALDQLARVRWPRSIAAGLLLVLVAGVVGAFRLDFSDSPLRTFPEDHPYRRGAAVLHDTRGWTGTLSVVSPSIAGDPVDNYEREWEVLARALEVIRPWQNVTAVLDPESALEDLTGGQLGWLDDLARMRDPAARMDFAGLVADDGSLRAAVFLRDVGLGSVAFLRDVIRVEGQQSGVYPAGELVCYADFAEAVPRALLRSLVACLVLVGTVVGLVAYARAGWSAVLPVLASAVWGPALVLVALALFSVPVNFLTCVFASVLVGLAGDNALQYLCAEDVGGRRLLLAEGAARRGGASIQVAVVMSLCALVFLGSAFVASRRLGLLLGLGLMASLVGDLWILRSLVDRRRPT